MRGKGNGAKDDVEKARDAALSTANQAHAQAGEKLGQLDAALGDADDQMVKLKEKDSEDSHDEILDRETAWENYEKELLTFTAVEAGHAADSTESTWGEWLKGWIPLWGTLSGWSESFDRRAAERDRLAAVIARGDFDSVYAMQQARVNALGGAVEGLYHASALQAEVGTEVVMAGFAGLGGTADDAFRWADDVAPNRGLVSSNELWGVEKASSDLIEAVGKRRAITWADEGTDALRYLDYRRAEAASLGADDIILRRNPSKAAVLEEFLHGTQQRAGIIDRLGRQGAESHVKDFIIRHQRLLGISDEDIAILKMLKDVGL